LFSGVWHVCDARRTLAHVLACREHCRTSSESCRDDRRNAGRKIDANAMNTHLLRPCATSLEPCLLSPITDLLKLVSPRHPFFCQELGLALSWHVRRWVHWALAPARCCLAMARRGVDETAGLVLKWHRSDRTLSRAWRASLNFNFRAKF
jgi:hypothetical protein